jgi:hypothetical protein
MNVYECKCHDVMYRANEYLDIYIRSHNHKLHSLRNDSNLFAASSAESAFIFRCKPPLGASSPFTSAESAFIFRCKLCIPLGTTFELLPVFFSFLFALDGAFSAFTFTSLGDIALIEVK